MPNIVITRVFHAPVEKVWKAWSEPEALMKWWGPKDTFLTSAKIDFRVGGKLIYGMPMPDGRVIWSTGTYLEIIPMKKIVTTDSFSDEQGNIVSAASYGFTGEYPLEIRIIVEFEEIEGHTTMTLTHEDLPAGEVYEMTQQSWNESFNKCAESLR